MVEAKGKQIIYKVEKNKEESMVLAVLISVLVIALLGAIGYFMAQSTTPMPNLIERGVSNGFNLGNRD